MKNFGTFARAAFFLYEGSFWKITIVSEKTCFFLSIWDLDWRGKKFDFWRFFVQTVVETLFWVSSAKIWFFLNNFYPLILFEIRARIVETFYAKILAHLLKLPSTSTDKQSEEKPSFRKNLVLHIFSWLGWEKFD